MPLARVLAALRAAPSRTGSVIITVYGDAIAPRGGSIALADLLALMAALGAGDGVVRTAVSRLARDGWLDRERAGRNSFYRLSGHGVREFADAIPRIYGPLDTPWGGQLRLAFAEAGVERTMLEQAGYALLAPGVLVAPDTALSPASTPALLGTGSAASMKDLAARAWPLAEVASAYEGFVGVFEDVAAEAGQLGSLDAMALRTMLIHEYRRVALRDPRLPPGLLPEGWPGTVARTLCLCLYTTLAPASERWLDASRNGSGPLPRGPDPVLRFSGGGRWPAAPAWSPMPAGNPRRRRSAAR